MSRRRVGVLPAQVHMMEGKQGLKSQSKSFQLGLPQGEEVINSLTHDFIWLGLSQSHNRKKDFFTQPILQLWHSLLQDVVAIPNGRGCLSKRIGRSRCTVSSSHDDRVESLAPDPQQGRGVLSFLCDFLGVSVCGTLSERNWRRLDYMDPHELDLQSQSFICLGPSWNSLQLVACHCSTARNTSFLPKAVLSFKGYYGAQAVTKHVAA